MAAIRQGGLHAGDGHWCMTQHRVPLDSLFVQTELSTADTRPGTGEPAVCVCGDESGASYYAWTHNRTGECNTPIIVELEADPNDCVVDGKDFLYTVFQFGDPTRARSVLARTFGNQVLKYAERAWSTEDQQSRSCFL